MKTTSNKKKRKGVPPASFFCKQPPWTIADDELLIKGYLLVFNDRTVMNTLTTQNGEFWERVLKYYMEGENSGAKRTADNMRSHLHMVGYYATFFNNIMIKLRAEKGSDWSEDELKTEAYKVYLVERKTHFIHEHVWNLIKDKPKWKTQVDIQEPKRTKASPLSEHITANNGVDGVSMPEKDYEVDELPRAMCTEKAKAKRSSNGKDKDVEDVTDVVDYMFDKKVDVIEQFNAKLGQLIALKERKLEMEELEILYKDKSKMDPEMLTFHKARCAVIMEKYGKKK